MRFPPCFLFACVLTRNNEFSAVDSCLILLLVCPWFVRTRVMVSVSQSSIAYWATGSSTTCWPKMCMVHVFMLSDESANRGALPWFLFACEERCADVKLLAAFAPQTCHPLLFSISETHQLQLNRTIYLIFSIDSTSTFHKTLGRPDQKQTFGKALYMCVRISHKS